MLIVDLQQCMISNLMVTLGKHAADTENIDEGLFRHFVLNSLRSYNTKFKLTYGEMVIACDDRNSWRRQYFPYYKANRKKARNESDINWPAIFGLLNIIKSELKEYFPYRVIEVPGCEADDVIGKLCQEFSYREKILVISGDRDFRQLQRYSNVEQYDPIKKKKIIEKNPLAYLKEHIIRGDVGDGVPNFLSVDDSLVLKIRQTPIREKTLEQWLKQDPSEFCDEKMLRGYKRNEMMVDLTMIPEQYKLSILETYNSESGKNRSKLMNFFIEKKLKNLMSDLTQF